MPSKPPLFPCKSLPADGRECRLLGLYPQRQEGLWMQRIKVLGGILSSAQWRALAELCRRYTPSAPLLLTTRQDIEFHNVTPAEIPLLQAELARHGLSGIGACGDTLRNITVCPGSGLCDKTPDLIPVAWALRKKLEDYQGIYSLPRKFKISFSACPKACAQPWINDLGFVFSRNHGETAIQIIGAGSLGPRPQTGMSLQENCRTQDILPFALAAIRVFDKYGDRVNRSKARLRHVRERIGDAQFKALLLDELRNTKADLLPGISEDPFPGRNLLHVMELNLWYGGLHPDQAQALAHITQDESIIVRLQTHHRISLFARDTDFARRIVLDCPSLAQLANGPDVVSCPGSTYCARALVNTHAVETAIRAQLSGGNRTAIRISGCPNMCAQSAVADIGLIGRVRTDQMGHRREGFAVVTGGGMGKTPTLARHCMGFIASEDAPAVIKKLVAKS